MRENDEDIQHAELYGGNSKEVDRDHLADVISKERHPGLAEARREAGKMDSHAQAGRRPGGGAFSQAAHDGRVYTHAVTDSKKAAAQRIGNELFSIVQFSGVADAKGGIDSSPKASQTNEVVVNAGS